VYARRLDNKILEFRHRGWLLDESFLFYDLDTDSLWCQATGRAVLGTRRGAKLDRLPVTHTTWGAWVKLYPATRVLAKPLDQRERYLRDGYEKYYSRHALTFGLAVSLADAQRLYPLDQLERTPVVNERLGNEAVLVVYHRPSETAVAYGLGTSSTIGPFDLVASTEADVIIVNKRSGRQWSGLTGKPLEPTADRRPLVRLETTQFVVQNFRRHYPHGTIYEAK
jgi:hypothetical protein